MEKSKRLTTADEIRIFSNHFRMKILSLFDCNYTSMTIKQMADKLGEVPSKVHYHVKALEKINVMEIVETKEKSGIIEKYYLPTAENFYIDNVVKTPGSKIYEDNQEDIFSNVMKEVYESIDSCRKNADPNEDSGRLFSQFNVYLTPAETRELHDICINYIKSKEKKEDSMPFNFTLLTIKKYD